MTAGSLLVVHGGAPTAVLNATLRGILDAAEGSFNTVLGARGGTGGALAGSFVDLAALSGLRRELLSRTPGTVIGTSRTPLADDDLAQLVDTCHRHGVSSVVFCGGNGTMDTCSRFRTVSASAGGPPIAVVGAPKTIDNDLACTDHAPGFGSAARYLAGTTAEIVADVRSLPIHVSIVEAMGRNAGWLTAAAAYASSQGVGPDLVYVPERAFDRSAFLERVQDLWRQQGYAVVVVSEGITDADGRPVVPPIFETGRSVYFGEVAAHLAQAVVAELGIKARAEKPGIAGRASIAWQSTTDVWEAQLVGRAAVDALLDGRDQVMVSLQREPGPDYSVRTELVDLDHLVLAERRLPDEYIAADGAGVTSAYLDWVAPLVGPLPELATAGGAL